MHVVHVCARARMPHLGGGGVRKAHQPGTPSGGQVLPSGDHQQQHQQHHQLDAVVQVAAQYGQSAGESVESLHGIATPNEPPAAVSAATPAGCRSAGGLTRKALGLALRMHLDSKV